MNSPYRRAKGRAARTACARPWGADYSRAPAQRVPLPEPPAPPEAPPPAWPTPFSALFAPGVGAFASFAPAGTVTPPLAALGAPIVVVPMPVVAVLLLGVVTVVLVEGVDAVVDDEVDADVRVPVDWQPAAST